MNQNPELETQRYLIHELEDLVNEEYLRLLGNAQHTISVEGYLPPTPYEVPDIIGLELEAAGLVPDEIVGVDASLTFPSEDPYGALTGYIVRWKNGVNWNVHNTDGVGPIMYAAHGDQIMGDVIPCNIDDLEPLIRAAGLPYDEMTSDESSKIQDLLAVLVGSSEKVTLSRQRYVALNPYSALRVVQDGALYKSAEPDNPDLVQELRLEVSHFADYGDRYPAATILNLPTSHPVHAQHVVFHQNQGASRWEYYASYDGPIAPGLLPGEYEESVHTLTVPPLRLSILIAEALQQVQNSLD